MIKTKWSKNLILFGLAAVALSLAGVYAIRVLVTEFSDYSICERNRYQLRTCWCIFHDYYCGNNNPNREPSHSRGCKHVWIACNSPRCCRNCRIHDSITINYYVAYFLGRPYVIKKVSRQIGRSNEAVEQMGYRPKTM